MEPLSVFLTAPAGLEPQLLDEAREIGVPGPKQVPGGVECQGGWEAVRRANLRARIASRVLARIARFPARGYPAVIAGLREVPWNTWLGPARAVRVEASSRGSRADHGGAIARHCIEALRRVGHREDPEGLRLLVRVERDICTVSIDTSGAPLHRRGAKQAINAAPLRETLAAGFLRAAGFDGQQPVFDPMCGSGTFVLEAASIARGLLPGTGRSFAFMDLPSHDPDRWTALQASAPRDVALRFKGADRSGPVCEAASENAARAGLADLCTFAQGELADAVPPRGPAGVVITNPPYGQRLGGKGVGGVYAQFGQVMQAQFAGWRVALITPDERLARATGLPWDAPGPFVDHGGTKIRLWQAQL